MKSDFYKHVALLVSGSAFAQAIGLGTMPILTRMYSPSDFGEFALFSSIAILLAQFATLRYEVAIMLAKTERDALDIGGLSAKLSVVFSGIVLIGLLIFDERIAKGLGIANSKGILYLLPLLVLLSGVYQALTFWSSRNKKFGDVARSQITQASFNAGPSIALGAMGFSTLGLVFGLLIGKSAGLLVLLIKNMPILSSYRKIDRTGQSESEAQLILAKKYKNQPLYNLPQSIVDHVRLIGINVTISRVFGTSLLGQFSMAWKLLQVPAQLIGGAMGQVFFQRVSEDDEADIFGISRKFTIEIVFVGFPVFVGLYFTAPWIFQTVFGSEWRTAGSIASALCPWAYMNFVSGPLSLVLVAKGRQRVLLLLGLVYAVLPLVLIYVSIGRDFLVVVEVLSFGMAGFLGVMIFLTLFLIKRPSL